MKTYLQYLKEDLNAPKGKLFVEAGEEMEWQASIDVSQLWQAFTSQKISLPEFNQQYAATLLNQQPQLSAGWPELEPVLNELQTCTDPQASETVYDKIYDICDEYAIEINTGTHANLETSPNL